MNWAAIIWTALVVGFLIIEAVCAVHLVSIWFAAGAMAALVCTLLGGPLWLQVTLFIVFSALCLLAVRPMVQKHFNSGVEATNADRILGTTAVVTREISNLLGQGEVKIAGQPWTARSQDDSVTPEGTRVKVLRIEGVKVFVERL